MVEGKRRQRKSNVKKKITKGLYIKKYRIKFAVAVFPAAGKRLNRLNARQSENLKNFIVIISPTSILKVFHLTLQFACDKKKKTTITR